MAQEEVYNTRDRSYSAWHRRKSTGRFIGFEHAQLLAMIDLDASLYVEYDDGTKEPIALIETAIDVGQPWKAATVTTQLAKRANLPCFVVLYKLSQDSTNPADTQWQDIESFRVKRLWPLSVQEIANSTTPQWEVLTPQHWAEKLLSMRKWSADKISTLDNPQRKA
jgi:hypothetical protein